MNRARPLSFCLFCSLPRRLDSADTREGRTVRRTRVEGLVAIR